MAALDADFYDELVDADGQARPHARTLVAALEALGPDALTQAGRRRDRRECSEDRHGGDRRPYGLLQPVAQTLEAPVDDPEVEAERAAELRVA